MIHRAVTPLHELLPTVHRQRDAEQGGPLRALLQVVEQEARALESDIEALYGDWFIETCDEWVVSYIGDLLGVRNLHAGVAGIFSLRAYVANSIAYRRRKGAAVVLEQVARDVSGWPARVVEYPQLLATTQHLRHIRPQLLRTHPLDDPAPFDLEGGPFDTLPHTVDVRRIASGRGRFNVPNVGLHMWRLQPYAVEGSTAHPARDPADPQQTIPRCYTFDPLGYPARLFTEPVTETEITHLAEEINVPEPIRAKALWADLAGSGDDPANSLYLGPGKSLGLNLVDVDDPEGARQILPDEVLVCDLRDWARPPADRVALDPLRGRIAFAEGTPDEPVFGVAPPDRLRVSVSYRYGFSADIGGGPYANGPGPVELPPEAVRPLGSGDGLQPALDAWAAEVERPSKVAFRFEPAGEDAGPEALTESAGRLLVEDSVLTIPQGTTVVIEAAERYWPQLRPAERIVVAPEAGLPSRLVISGLRIEGGIRLDLTDGTQFELYLHHCTLVPGRSRTPEGAPADPDWVSLEGGGGQPTSLQVTLDHCITGPLRLPADRTVLVARDCILDTCRPSDMSAAGVRLALAGNATPPDAPLGPPGPPAIVERCTVLGGMAVRELRLASDSIFTAPVTAVRQQTGCVRYCFLPAGSQVPNQYRCQPAHALAALPADDTGARRRTRERVRPLFNSVRYGHPAYAQLATVCAAELRAGGSGGLEMGAFYGLRQPHRESNLRGVLPEYLRYGLEAGVFFAT